MFNGPWVLAYFGPIKPAQFTQFCKAPVSGPNNLLPPAATTQQPPSTASDRHLPAKLQRLFKRTQKKKKKKKEEEQKRKPLFWIFGCLFCYDLRLNSLAKFGTIWLGSSQD